MKFVKPLKSGQLVRRYKRFLADVRCPGETLTAGGKGVTGAGEMPGGPGEIMTVHCPNTGAMTGCNSPGLPVWLSHSDNPKRRYAWTWEVVAVPPSQQPQARPSVLVGVHTGRSNTLVGEALTAALITPLHGYRPVKREVAIPGASGRFDWLLQGPAGPCWLEVKNVTAAVDNGVALFPDAISRRASRHARELARLSQAGHTTALVFCVQRNDVHSVRPAAHIDPDYAQALQEAATAGVIISAIACQVTLEGITPEQVLPVLLD